MADTGDGTSGQGSTMIELTAFLILAGTISWILYKGQQARGKPVTHEDGYVRSTRSYDARGNVIEWACSGAGGEPVKHRQGYASWRNTWDDRGNPVSQAYFGLDGQPCLHVNGYASVTASYDRNGRMAEAVFHGIDGQPANRTGGYARAVRSYKPGGEPLSTAYFDAAGVEVFPAGGDLWDFKMEDGRPGRPLRLGYCCPFERFPDY